MENMICFECVFKHLAAALSYGKEIMSGHGKGNALDHRIDYLGELVNAEHHLELMDKELFANVSNFRKEAQAKKCAVDIMDLSILRNIYLEIERFSEIGRNDTQSKIFANRSAAEENFKARLNIKDYTEKLDIVFDAVSNLKMFKYAYDSIIKYAKNRGNIYVLKSSVDLSEFDVELVNKNLYDFCADERLSNDFLIGGENMCLMREFDVLKSFPVHSYKTTDSLHRTAAKLKEHGYTGQVRQWDNLKLQPINKAQYSELMKDVNVECSISAYYSLKNEPRTFNAQNIVCSIDQPICCGTKSQLKNTVFVVWRNEEMLDNLIEFLEPIAKVIPAAFIARAKAETGSDSTGYPTGSRSNLPGSILDDVDKIHSN